MAINRSRCYACNKGVTYGNAVSHSNMKTRRVLLLACETLFPKDTPFSHEKQRLRLMAMVGRPVSSR